MNWVKDKNGRWVRREEEEVSWWDAEVLFVLAAVVFGPLIVLAVLYNAAQGLFFGITSHSEVERVHWNPPSARVNFEVPARHLGTLFCGWGLNSIADYDSVEMVVDNDSDAAVHHQLAIEKGFQSRQVQDDVRCALALTKTGRLGVTSEDFWHRNSEVRSMRSILPRTILRAVYGWRR